MKHNPPHKRGDVRPDGMIYWGASYHGPEMKVYEEWYTKDDFLSKKLERRMYDIEYKKQHPERRKSRTTNACRKRYYNRHRKECIARSHAWNVNHPDVRAKHRSIRRSRECVDPSANSNKIRQFYLMRDRLKSCTGIDWHVDHIVPLSRGGRHHENNLQVITAALNFRKYSKT